MFFKAIGLPFAVILATASTLQAGNIFANANLTTGANDGTSWADAYQGPASLRKAANKAVAGDVIFVAQGTYTPAAGTVRGASIGLASGVEIYGGFLGTESSPDERPPIGTAPSIVNGDLNGDDSMGMLNDNSYHLFKAFGADSTAILDGFELRGGNANGAGNDDVGAGILFLNGGSPTIRNCTFVDNRCTFGGAACYINGAGATFIDCTFEGNDGGSFGGAIDIATGLPVQFDRCTFRGNTAARAGALEIFSTQGVTVSNSLFVDNLANASDGGGGLWIGSGSTADLSGCTIVANRAPNSTVGGLRQLTSTVTAVNCIFWDNVGQGGGQGSDNQVSSGVDVSYSIVEGGASGAGNLNLDPAFIDSAAGDYRLSAASPAVDAGDSGGVTAGAPLDLGRAPRRVDDPAVADSGTGGSPATDMGAFERCIGVVDTLCEALPNSTGTPSVLVATGSLSVIANDVNLVAEHLPLSQFGYFLLSASRDTIPVSAGVLCLGAPQLRFNQDVLDSGTAGSMSFSPDLTSLPQGQVVQAGETWYFQLWHRDGPDSNFSSSLAFTWE